MATLTVITAKPGMTVQDLGRPGWRAQGLSQGGAADPLALAEAAALLGTDPANAVIEITGAGGAFSVDEGVRFCLTGATADIAIDGNRILANTTCFLPAGTRLTIGPARQGVYSYLCFAGGIQSTRVMGSRATHLTAGIGGYLDAGMTFALGSDPDRTRAPCKLAVPDRFHGGTLRVMPGPQTDLFDKNTRSQFAQTVFQRNPRGNRQGVRLDYTGPRVATTGGLTLVSDLIVPGDIQITGDGTPYVLLSECQTIGGYPRIGSVIPADLPRLAQAPPGTTLRFEFITTSDADATFQSQTEIVRQLAKRCEPVVRDPHDIADLLRYQLISGATRGDDLERAD